MDFLINVFTWGGMLFLLFGLPISAYRAFGKDTVFHSLLLTILGPAMAIVMIILWVVGLMRVQKEPLIVVCGLVIFLVLFVVAKIRRKKEDKIVKVRREAFNKKLLVEMKQEIKNKLGFEYTASDDFLLAIYEIYENLRKDEAEFFSYVHMTEGNHGYSGNDGWLLNENKDFSSFFLMERPLFIYRNGYETGNRSAESQVPFERAQERIHRNYREMQHAYLKLFKLAGMIREVPELSYKTLGELCDIYNLEKKSWVYAQYISNNAALNMMRALISDESYFRTSAEYEGNLVDEEE